MPASRLTLAAAAVLLLAGCRHGGPAAARAAHAGAAPTSAGTSATAPPSSGPATAAPAASQVPTAARTSGTGAAPGTLRQAATRFRWHAAPVTAAELGRSWHAGCPVGPAALRLVTMTYWGFDGRAHTGALVVRDRAVPAIVGAFRAIYDGRFPIRQMTPIAAYGGDDNASMAADNTSAFNCRYAVASGPKHWSMHAYGEAVDVDPRENPYTLDGRVYPPSGRPYTDRRDVRPGMITPGGVAVRAFSAVGWGWGGRWSSSPDLQHFSSSGQ